MTPTQQRITIAEACGWTKIKNGDIGNLIDVPIGYYPDAQDPTDFNVVPDYLNDLNAMHEAEKFLTDSQKVKYCHTLSSLNEDTGEPTENIFVWYVHATASQRAEAFLRTLNLWKD